MGRKTAFVRETTNDSHDEASLEDLPIKTIVVPGMNQHRTASKKSMDSSSGHTEIMGSSIGSNWGASESSPRIDPAKVMILPIPPDGDTTATSSNQNAKHQSLPVSNLEAWRDLKRQFDTDLKARQERRRQRRQQQLEEEKRKRQEQEECQKQELLLQQQQQQERQQKALFLQQQQQQLQNNQGIAQSTEPNSLKHHHHQQQDGPIITIATSPRQRQRRIIIKSSKAAVPTSFRNPNEPTKDEKNDAANASPSERVTSPRIFRRRRQADSVKKMRRASLTFVSPKSDDPGDADHSRRRRTHRRSRPSPRRAAQRSMALPPPPLVRGQSLPEARIVPSAEATIHRQGRSPEAARARSPGKSGRSRRSLSPRRKSTGSASPRHRRGTLLGTNENKNIPNHNGSSRQREPRAPKGVSRSRVASSSTTKDTLAALQNEFNGKGESPSRTTKDHSSPRQQPRSPCSRSMRSSRTLKLPLGDHKMSRDAASVSTGHSSPRRIAPRSEPGDRSRRPPSVRAAATPQPHLLSLENGNRDEKNSISVSSNQPSADPVANHYGHERRRREASEQNSSTIGKSTPTSGVDCSASNNHLSIASDALSYRGSLRLDHLATTPSLVPPDDSSPSLYRREYQSCSNMTLSPSQKKDSKICHDKGSNHHYRGSEKAQALRRKRDGCFHKLQNLQQKHLQPEPRPTSPSRDRRSTRSVAV